MKHYRWLWLVVCVTLCTAGIVSAEDGGSAMSPSAAPMGGGAGEMGQGREYDFGDYTSATLTGKAWDAYNNGDYEAVDVYAGKCIELFQSQADEQSKSTTDFAPKDAAFSLWALNDVATCHFIIGQTRLAQGRVKEAQDAFHTIIEKYPYAQCWDPKGWFWKVAEAANDKLGTIGTPYDFGDYSSSTLTVRAWEALAKGDHKGVEMFVKKCVELYEAEARKQQAAVTDFAPKDRAFDYWALNDVGTCFFILGKSLRDQKRYPEARAAFERVINDFGFAQCWDPKGWFWKVRTAAEKELKEIAVVTGG